MSKLDSGGPGLGSSLDMNWLGNLDQTSEHVSFLLCKMKEADHINDVLLLYFPVLGNLQCCANKIKIKQQNPKPHFQKPRL